MRDEGWKKYVSHGDGDFKVSDFRKAGDNLVLEKGVLVFHPENIVFGSNVYVGHLTILKAYHLNELVIEDNVWIGQHVFIHAAGGVHICRTAGIGPGAKIISSSHSLDIPDGLPAMAGEIIFSKVCIGPGSDIGVGAVILPGVRIGEGAVVGAGAVVTSDVEPYTVVAGVPARKLRDR